MLTKYKKSCKIKKKYIYELKVSEIDLCTLSQVNIYCGKYAFPLKCANRVQVVIEELLTCLQSIGKDGNRNLTVAYEDTTGKKEVILRDKVYNGNILESDKMDERSAMIVKNCVSEVLSI